MKTKTHTCDSSVIVSQKGTHVFISYTKENRQEIFDYPTRNGATAHFKRITSKSAGRPKMIRPIEKKWYHQIFAL